jgi:hypothetical protein
MATLHFLKLVMLTIWSPRTRGRLWEHAKILTQMPTPIHLTNQSVNLIDNQQIRILCSDGFSVHSVLIID